MAAIAEIILNPCFLLVLAVLLVLLFLKPSLPERLLIGLKYVVPPKQEEIEKTIKMKYDAEQTRNRKKARNKASKIPVLHQSHAELNVGVINRSALYEVFGGMVTVSFLGVCGIILGQIMRMVIQYLFYNDGDADGTAVGDGMKYEILLAMAAIVHGWYSLFQIFPYLSWDSYQVRISCQISMVTLGVALACLRVSSLEGGGSGEKDGNHNAFEFRLDEAYTSFGALVSGKIIKHISDTSGSTVAEKIKIPHVPLGVVHLMAALAASALTLVNLMCAFRVVKVSQDIFGGCWSSDADTSTLPPQPSSSLQKKKKKTRKTTSTSLSGWLAALWRGSSSSSPSSSLVLIVRLGLSAVILLLPAMISLLWIPMFSRRIIGVQPRPRYYHTPSSFFSSSSSSTHPYEEGAASPFLGTEHVYAQDGVFAGTRAALCVVVAVIRVMLFRGHMQTYLLGELGGLQKALECAQSSSSKMGVSMISIALERVSATNKAVCAVALQLLTPSCISLLLALLHCATFKVNSRST